MESVGGKNPNSFLNVINQHVVLFESIIIILCGYGSMRVSAFIAKEMAR